MEHTQLFTHPKTCTISAESSSLVTLFDKLTHCGFTIEQHYTLSQAVNCTDQIAELFDIIFIEFDAIKLELIKTIQRRIRKGRNNKVTIAYMPSNSDVHEQLNVRRIQPDYQLIGPVTLKKVSELAKQIRMDDLIKTLENDGKFNHAQVNDSLTQFRDFSAENRQLSYQLDEANHKNPLFWYTYVLHTLRNDGLSQFSMLLKESLRHGFILTFFEACFVAQSTLDNIAFSDLVKSYQSALKEPGVNKRNIQPLAQTFYWTHILSRPVTSKRRLELFERFNFQLRKNFDSQCNSVKIALVNCHLSIGKLFMAYQLNKRITRHVLTTEQRVFYKRNQLQGQKLKRALQTGCPLAKEKYRYSTDFRPELYGFRIE